MAERERDDDSFSFEEQSILNRYLITEAEVWHQLSWEVLLVICPAIHDSRFEELEILILISSSFQLGNSFWSDRKIPYSLVQILPVGLVLECRHERESVSKIHFFSFFVADCNVVALRAQHHTL